jgi:hypothetical protein
MHAGRYGQGRLRLVPQVRPEVKPPKLDVVAELQGRHRNGFERVRHISTLALCASGLVWLIACGNVL